MAQRFFPRKASGPYFAKSWDESSRYLVAADGLPLGVQIVGRPVGEGRLLALATQLEKAKPWADRTPLAASKRERRGLTALLGS